MKRYGLLLLNVFIICIAANAHLAFLDPGVSALESDQDTGTWRHLITFDVMDTVRDHKADLGDHTILIAKYVQPLGWDIGVYQYPISSESLNLLYNGHNWHGVQEWDVFAFTKHKQIYPDVRLIEYGSSKRKLKIILKDCKTRWERSDIVFTKGKVQIYHQP